jgi:hypothetical protein
LSPESGKGFQPKRRESLVKAGERLVGVNPITIAKNDAAMERHRLQSSSVSRLTAGAAGFLLLIQSAERPER